MKSDTFSQMAYNQTIMSHRASSRFSEVNLLLLRAEHISDAGGASVITVVRKGKKPVGQL